MQFPFFQLQFKILAVVELPFHCSYTILCAIEYRYNNYTYVWFIVMYGSLVSDGAEYTK